MILNLKNYSWPELFAPPRIIFKMINIPQKSLTISLSTAQLTLLTDLKDHHHVFCFIYRHSLSTLLNHQVYSFTAPFQNSTRNYDYMTSSTSCSLESQNNAQVQVHNDRKEVKAHGITSRAGNHNQQIADWNFHNCISILPHYTKSSEIFSFINFQLTCNAQRVET